MEQAVKLGQGRKRNTMNNKASKQNMFTYDAAGISGGGLPTLDPSAAANYYGQIQTLQSSLQAQLASLKQQRIGLRGDASVARADARQQGRAALVETVNNSLERGMLGGTADLKARTQVKAATAGAVTDVNRQLYDQLAQNRLAGTQAALQTEQAIQGVEANAIAQRMNLAAQEKSNAIAIQAAQMQAAASAASTEAQMAMARKELRIQRQTALGYEAMANNPMSIYQMLGIPPPKTYASAAPAYGRNLYPTGGGSNQRL